MAKNEVEIIIPKKRGRPKKVDNTTASTIQDESSKIGIVKERVYPNFYLCTCCGRKLNYLNNFTSSKSNLYAGYNYHIPVCTDCLDKIFKHYMNVYNERYPNENNIEYRATRRLCELYDIYYSDQIVGNTLKKLKATPDLSFMRMYIKYTNLYPYSGKTYDSTIDEERGTRYEFQNPHGDYDGNGNITDSNSSNNSLDEEDIFAVTPKTIEFFGTGYSDDDYRFLQKEYDDWTSRHECKTKTQEEIFKRICFKQLEILKATRIGSDTKDLDRTFQEYLATAKLQPKQNSGDTIGDAQTFGTLIDKWENTRPLPEIDEELRDIDKIGQYITVFFTGHLSKMVGIKNGVSKLYERFIKQLTVNKPEYNDAEDSEVLFDTLFGNHDLIEDYANPPNDNEGVM